MWHCYSGAYGIPSLCARIQCWVITGRGIHRWVPKLSHCLVKCLVHIDVISASVCSGEQLSLSCHAAPNVTLLQWNITIPDRLGRPDLRFLSSSGSTTSVTPLVIGQTVFQFLRISVSPLTSTLVINNVSMSVNGTRVECSYNGEVMETTIINVIGNGMYI